MSQSISQLSQITRLLSSW